MIKAMYEFCNVLRERKILGWQYVYKLCKLILNVMYPLLHRNGKQTVDAAEGKMIVTMASFPKRIDKVWITIETIMNQTVKPKKIILCLAEDLFPNGEADLPKELLKQKSRGLEICFCEDLWPHKKYFYTMQKYPDDVIVTIDDDIFYPENVLEQLWAAYQKYPNAVSCERGHVVAYTEDGAFAKYNDWDSEKKGLTEPTLQLFPIGCGGVLYPPHLLHEGLFNKEEIKELCLANDDIWLKTMEIMNGVPAVRARATTLIYFDIVGTRKSALLLENANECRNDKILKAVCERYPQLLEVMYEDWTRGCDKAK